VLLAVNLICQKYNELKRNYDNITTDFNKIRSKMGILEIIVKDEIENYIREFNTIYAAFLKEVDSEVQSAYLTHAFTFLQ
jgi:archaellum component FlaC